MAEMLLLSGCSVMNNRRELGASVRKAGVG
jgi:hypothetical protein